MRLLKRNSDGKLTFTKDLSEAELPGYRYAILSHTWGADEEEVTYEDVAGGISTTKPGIGSAKIRFCIEQTRQDELEYFWVDTCCIDKRNLVELDKSLRSMFRWYANAERCYVYLSDLPLLDDLSDDWAKEFRSHRWFRRGWTLQELIAPRSVEFFTKDGQSVGTKQSLEKQISEITRIPIPALRGQPLSSFPIAKRKQWQEGRETREPEDLVYSLLGLLDVSMPVLYGEGKAKAWERLESAIIIARKGLKHDEFSLAFSLADAAVETQHFVAREAELQEIHRHLSSDGSRKVVVLRGLGGIGKTQLAMRYAKRHRDDYSALLWLNAKDETSARLSFVKMAKQILRQHPDAIYLSPAEMNTDLDMTIGAVRAWLSMPLNARWLLICDNYDNPKVSGNRDSAAVDLRQYIPETHQGSIIVTTRSAEVKLGHQIYVKKLVNLQDSLKILQHASDRAELEKDDGAIRLAKKLDGLPLALATAGAYLSQSTITFDEYLEFFEKSWARLHQRLPELVTYGDRTLYSTWQISYDQIEKRNSVSAQLLHLWAYFDNQDLWFELLQHLSSQELGWTQDLVEDRLCFDECMRVLCDHGLVEVNTENVYATESRGYSIHTCVHAWMTAVLNAEGDAELATAAVDCVASHIPNMDERYGPMIQRRLLNHADRTVGFMNVAQESMSEDWACHKLGILYYCQDRLDEAEKMYMRALRGYEKALGADHTSTLEAVNNLGVLYKDQGKLDRAKKMFMRALEGFEKALGADHVSTLDTVNNLGLLYRDQGKLDEAEKMYMRALRGCEKALGADHTSTLDTVNNLGLLYSDQGKLDEAEKLYMRALGGTEKALGADHTWTLQTLNDLGRLYKCQGKLDEAETMYMRALRGKEKALGADHTSTLNTVIELSHLCIEQKRFDDAKALHTRARNGYERKSPWLRPYVDRLESSLFDAMNTSGADTTTSNSLHRAVKDQRNDVVVMEATIVERELEPAIRGSKRRKTVRRK